MHSLWVESRGVYRALDEPCKAYFPHDFGLTFPDFFFGGLTIVRLVSGVARAGKGLPCPFSLVGFLCRCSVSVKSSAFRIRLGFLETVRLRFFLRLFLMDFTASFRHYRRRRLHCSLPLSRAKFKLFITLHLIVFALDKWSFHSQRFNQSLIILRRNLVNRRLQVIQLQWEDLIWPPLTSSMVSLVSGR